jgi:hypothetical protein
MLSASAIRCIERVRMGFVASITPDGCPSLSPKGTFVNGFNRKGWRLRGTTSVLPKGSVAFNEIYPHWQILWGDLAMRINLIVTVNISDVRPLSTPLYDDGVTEPEMVASYKEKYAQMYP